MGTQAGDRIKELEAQRELFEHDYVYMHPRPKDNIQSQRRVLIIMLGAAVIASARHNIPFFLGDETPNIYNDPIGLVLTIIFALSIVLMVEIGLVKIGEFLVEYLDMETVEAARPIVLMVALILLFLVAVSSNIIHQLEIKGEIINPQIVTLINILAGLSAPIMALITGVIFASLELKLQRAQFVWQEGFNKEWDRFKKKNDVSITVSKPQTPQLDSPRQASMSVSNQTDNRQTGAGFRRSSTAIDNARQWLLANPDRVSEPARQLAKDVPNAGKDSINTARNQLRQEGLI